VLYHGYGGGVPPQLAADGPARPGIVPGPCLDRTWSDRSGPKGNQGRLSLEVVDLPASLVFVQTLIENRAAQQTEISVTR